MSIHLNLISIFFSQSIGDTVRSLDFLQWMEMLKKVFDSSLSVLKRMQVHRITTDMVCFVSLIPLLCSYHVDTVTARKTKFFFCVVPGEH